MKEITWLFFNTVIPLIPVGAVKALSWLTAGSAPGVATRKTIFSIIKDGQIFFYCTALAAVAIGDLPKVPIGFDTTPWLMGLLLVIILSTLAFAVAAHSTGTLKEKEYGWCSVAMAVVAVLTVLNFRAKAGLL